jgi:MFS family permease
MIINPPQGQSCPLGNLAHGSSCKTLLKEQDIGSFEKSLVGAFAFRLCFLWHNYLNVFERTFVFYFTSSHPFVKREFDFEDIYYSETILNLPFFRKFIRVVELMEMPTLEESIRKHLKFNITVNLLDGAFFGLGWGFGSFGTIVTLFVSRMTHSALLIGLIPAIHAVGWQLPQLFMANSISRLRRYKPMVMWMTIHERLPFLGLALIALFMVTLGNKAALGLTFIILIWQGLGAGFTANGWQSLVAKIIPPEMRGTFFGAQGALANVLISVAAISAGYILSKVQDPLNFAICFTLTIVGMGFSMMFLGLTREPVDNEKTIPEHQASPWKGGWEVLRRDRNFSAFLGVRLISQFATMGFAFYIVYGLQRFGMSDLTAGFLTAAVTLTQMVANIVMGWLGDRFGHRAMLISGSVAVVLSSLMAWGAPSLIWMYPVFILSGLANVAYWTIGMAITAEFGSEETRPTYIGLSNTLVAPFTIIAPLLGGWIADMAGFQTTFMLSAIGGLITAVLLIWLVRDPRPRRKDNRNLSIQTNI